MLTKSLDKMSRTGAFHHLSLRKVTIAGTGFHEFNDLKKTVANVFLSIDESLVPNLRGRSLCSSLIRQHYIGPIPESARRGKISTAMAVNMEYFATSNKEQCNNQGSL